MAWTTPKTDWTTADGIADTDLNRIEANILYLKTNHADLETGIHGAVSVATADKLLIRDAYGRARVSAPSAEEDIALKATVTAEAALRAAADAVLQGQIDGIPTAYMPIAGGTFTGKAYAQSNTDYTTGQIRNIFFSTAAPTTEGNNGDAWMQYES